MQLRKKDKNNEIEEAKDEMENDENQYETVYETDTLLTQDEQQEEIYDNIDNTFHKYKISYKPQFRGYLDMNSAQKHEFVDSLFQEQTEEQEVGQLEYYDDDLISFTNLHGVSNKKCRLREYVDVMQNKDLVQDVKDLLYKLKELFYNRKMKPQKGKYKKVNLAPKKRYLIGLKENMKYLQARKINMIIIATNIEKVDGDRGLDEFLYNMIQEC